MRVHTLVVALASLQLCAARPIEVPTLPATAHSVQIVSAIPKELRYVTFGMTVFQNVEDKVDISDWRLNDLALETVSSLLSPRFSVSHYQVDLGISELDRDSDLIKFMKQELMRDSKQDVYLVIWPTSRADSRYGREFPLGHRGVGVTKMETMFSSQSPTVHTYLMVTLLSGDTFEKIVSEPLRGGPPQKGRTLLEARAEGPSYGPTMPLPDFDWKVHWVQLSMQQQKEIHAAVQEVLVRSLTYTLHEMHLAQ